MSDDIAVSVRNLTKTYRLFGHPGDRIKQFFSLGLKHYHREFTALKDVSFDIKKGETVGIVGRNGSGKSTLLQLICGILKPTSGTVQVNGRVSALLELGAGFNPEFTGRENVYFQGSLMGFDQAQMDERFDAIASFADIGEFVDQPVRTYSSGMFVRLAFAVAIHVAPGVLVIDEAIAVGDPGFRARCFRRIGELREAGCTILFVSHATDQVAALCGSVILLDEGEMLYSGMPEPAIARFLHLINANKDERPALKELIKCGTVTAEETISPADEAGQEIGILYEPNGALITDVCLMDSTGQRATLLRSGEFYRCRYTISFTSNAALVRSAVLFKTRDGHKLGGCMTAPNSGGGIPSVLAGATAVAEVEFECRLNPGRYLLNVAVFASTAGIEYALHGIQGAIGFQVVSDSVSTGIGAVDFGMKATIGLDGLGGGA